jgi:hypothetical protein
MPQVTLSPEDRILLMGIRKDLDNLKKVVIEQAEAWIDEAVVIKNYKGLSHKTLYRKRKSGEIPARAWRANGKFIQYKESAIEDLYK